MQDISNNRGHWDYNNLLYSVKDVKIVFSWREADFFNVLWVNFDNIVRSERLYFKVFGQCQIDPVVNSNVHVNIFKIRNKLKEKTNIAILNISRVGYIMTLKDSNIYNAYLNSNRRTSK